MKKRYAWARVIPTILLLLAAGCGGSEATNVDEALELGGGHASLSAACCRRAHPPGLRRARCMAEARMGRGVCARPCRHDGGSSDAGSSEAGSGGAGGAAGSDVNGGQAGTATGGAPVSEGGVPMGGAGGSSAQDAGSGAAGAPADAGEPAECLAYSPKDDWRPESRDGYPTVLFATDPDNLWMLDQSSAVVRFTQTSQVPALIALPNESFYALWGSSSNDVWVGGSRLHHWNGVAWFDVTPLELQMDPTREVRTLAGHAADDIWLAATPLASGVSARLFHWDGLSWTERTPPESLTGGPAVVSDIWASASHDAWATARWQAGGADWGGVLRWTGAAWVTASSGDYLHNNWHSVWGSSDNDVWVVGQIGMAHFDGGSWLRDNTVTNIARVGGPVLWGSCAGSIWTFGPKAQIWNYDGVHWSQVPYDARVSQLRTVTGTGPYDVWFGGGDYSGGGVPITLRRRANLCGNGRIDPGETCDPPDGAACDASCHAACVASGGDCSTGVASCCGGLRCLGGTCQCVPTGSSCNSGDTCCTGSCTNGTCREATCVAAGSSCGAGDTCCSGSCTNGTCCQRLGNSCNASNPCCSGMVCSPQGQCVQPQPACMPDGGICSSQIPCCSGAPCVNGLCGGACILDGAACDSSHPCCSSGSACTDGVCGGVACIPLGQLCGSLPGLTCCDGNRCGGFGACRTQGGSCADVGMTCDAVGNGCCSGSTCVAGHCTVVTGCYPSGQYCNTNGGGQPCCSGTCVIPTGVVGHCL